jgi:hypothetical protein
MFKISVTAIASALYLIAKKIRKTLKRRTPQFQWAIITEFLAFERNELTQTEG